MGIVGFSVIGCLIFIVALGLLIGALVTYQRQSRQNADRLSAQGVVVALEKRVMNPGSGGVYCPVVKFTPPNGQEIQFTSDYGTLPASHKVGQGVTVLYNPLNPQEAEVFSTVSRYLAPGIMVFMALIAFCLGGSFLLFSFIMYAASATP